MFGTMFKLMPIVAMGAGVAKGKDEVGHVGQEVIDAVNKLRTNVEMRGIVKMVRLDIIAGESMPKDIVEYARENMDSQGSDPGKDVWETEWMLEKDDTGTYLTSCGPDTECYTEDDLREIIMDSTGRFRKKRY